MINKIGTGIPSINFLNKSNNKQSNKDFIAKRAYIEAKTRDLNDITLFSLILGCVTQIVAPVHKNSQKINKVSLGLILLSTTTFIASCVKKMRLARDYDLQQRKSNL